MNDLTEQIPKTIYVTYEQNFKNKIHIELLQKNIDNAFLKPARVSNNIAKFSEYNICLLNGQYTNRLGVINKINDENSEEYNITDIERTLIDITVRPAYSAVYKKSLELILKLRIEFL